MMVCSSTVLIALRSESTEGREITLTLRDLGVLVIRLQTRPRGSIMTTLTESRVAAVLASWHVGLVQP